MSLAKARGKLTMWLRTPEAGGRTITNLRLVGQGSRHEVSQSDTEMEV